MKKQILTLMLGAVVFATSPAFAMDEQEDAPKGGATQPKNDDGKRLVESNEMLFTQSKFEGLQNYYYYFPETNLLEELYEARVKSATASSASSSASSLQ